MIARAAGLLAIAVGLGAAAVASPATPAAASVGTVSFSTTPALYPAFDPTVSDYVVRCDAATPVDVSVTNSDGADTTTTVSVDGQTPQTGTFVASVSLAPDQEFSVVATQGPTTKEYFVRCLPYDFPAWTSDRPGTPQAEYYVVAPSLGFAATNRYVMIYDTDGVPIWWTLLPTDHWPVDAKLTSTGHVLWTEGDLSLQGRGAQERTLDGATVATGIVPDGYPQDNHEVQLLPNGNYLVMGAYDRCCFDLTPYGGPAGASVLDNVIQEVTPAGTALWTWKAADHIGVDETGPLWWVAISSIGSPYDTFHMNSVVMDATGDLLVSLRHVNAVYKIKDPTAPTDAGKIIWKLGGSAPTMEPGTQLTVVGDPVFDAGGGFGGQHYARFYDAGDGNEYVTLHDNGTLLGRPPRGVRFQIDEGAATATMIEDVRDNADPGLSSFCCGSAGKLPGGNWVASWGYGHSVMELTPAGDRVFIVTLNEPSYRADPVLPGVLTRQALRAGMDAQYLQTITDSDGDGCIDINEPLLVPPTDPANPWDFYSVPIPALFASANPLADFRDNAVTATDSQAIFAYFKAGATAGTSIYDQDLNANGIPDGVEYDRSYVGPGQSGAPDGVVSASDAQIAFAQFKLGYRCL